MCYITPLVKKNYSLRNRASVHKPWWFLLPAKSGCSIHSRWGSFWSVQGNHILIILQYPHTTLMPTQSHCNRTLFSQYACTHPCKMFFTHASTHRPYQRTLLLFHYIANQTLHYFHAHAARCRSLRCGTFRSWPWATARPAFSGGEEEIVTVDHLHARLRCYAWLHSAAGG